MNDVAALPDHMTVVDLNGVGGPEVLALGQRAVPAPDAGEVLIKVAGVGVNGPDMMQRRGEYPPPPGASNLMGLEVSGQIVALGDGVSAWQIGDEVCALTNGGGYAQYVCVTAAHCLPVPEGVSLVDAAGLPETYFTVWSNIFLTPAQGVGGANLRSGETLLVHGGAGGIGSTAIQLGAAFGAKVFATASSAERCALCSELGAARAINYREEDFVEVLKEAGGADVILDFIGGDYIARNFKAAARDGRIVQLAFRNGAKVEVNLMPIMLKRLSLAGSTLRPRSHDQKAAIAAALRDQVWPLFGTGKLRALTDRTFPLADAAAAHELMEASGHTGKILLVP